MNSSTRTIDDVCLQIVDCEHKTAPIDPAGDYFAVGTPAMRGNAINYSESRRISKDTFDKWTRRLAPQMGDLLFAREAPVGPIVRIPETGNVAPGQRTVLLRPNPALVDSNFLYYLLTSPLQQERLLSMATGSTVAHLNVADVRAFHLPALPSVEHQGVIAEVLGALDDKIDANAQLVQTSATLTQAMFSEAVRTSADEVVLSEVTELLSRGITPKYSHDQGTVVILNQKCIRGQRVDLDPARRTLKSKVREEKLLMMDDVLVNSTGQGTLGRVARWTHKDSVTVDSHITIVRFDQDKTDPVCAGLALLGMQETIVEMGEGSTGQTELSRTELGKLRMRLPERERQAELGRRLASMAEMERAHLMENRVLTTTRDALVPQLMSGKLLVKDAEKVLEVAGV